MADSDKISYSDIISPDDSIERLIRELSEVNKSYEKMVNAIRAGAERITYAVKSASGATSEGRKSIDEAAVSASRLERAQKELALALSSTGQQIAWLKAQTNDANKATVARQRYLAQEVSSYERLKSDLKQAVDLYNSLSKSERESSELGRQLLADIISQTQQLKLHDDQLRQHVSQLNAVALAEQKLAFLQSEEGQRLLELKAKIAEVTKARKSEKEALDPIEAAKQKLAQAQSEENTRLKEYSILTHEANRVAKLTAQLNMSAEGSYNRLAAQYELNKIKLNAMSAEERKNTEAGKALEQQTKEIYEEMKRLQEATGKHTLSVGDYGRVWDRLGFSINQVVREMPALAIDFNTFFLAISNNIPMVIDEINKMRKANEALRAEGKKAPSVFEGIKNAIFSWNTALVVGLTLLSVYGKDMIAFVKTLFGAKREIMSATEQMKAFNEEFKNHSGNLGSQIVKLRELKDGWSELNNEVAKQDWIKEHKKDFDELGIAIDDVNGANLAFIEMTDDLVEAFRLRAKAAAASQVAQKKYAEAEEKRLEQQRILNIITDPETKDIIEVGSDKQKYRNLLRERIGNWKYGILTAGGGDVNPQKIVDLYKRDADKIEDEIKIIEAEADIFYDRMSELSKEANAKLGSLAKKKEDEEDKYGGRKRTPRDLTDTINRNQIELEKKYQQSITKLSADEFAKRKKEANDAVMTENEKLREMYRKNVAYVNNVDGKFKELTESQKEQIKQQNDWIIQTIKNNLEYLERQLDNIQREQEINTLRIRRNIINTITDGTAADGNTVTSGLSLTRDTKALEESYSKERDLLEKNLAVEYELMLNEAEKQRKLGILSARSEEEILIEFLAKKRELYAQYDEKIYALRQTDIDNQLKLVKKGTEDELELLIQRNENERKLALAKNLGLPPEKQVSTSTINAVYGKSGKLLVGQQSMAQYDQNQRLYDAIFNSTKHNEDEITRYKLEQERARWEYQIQLAEAGGLDWSDVQIETARETVKGIDREISELTDFWEQVQRKGLGGTLLEKLGFTSEAINALGDAVNTTLGYIQEIIDAEVELAEKAVEAAEARVEAAQSAYEAEVEGRNNGYANNVATARKELDLAKKQQREKEKLLEQAKKRQEAVDTVIQASSLVTATANLWASLSKVPLIGHALALAAIATMWTSFAAAKVKARQVTSSSEEYGEGGLEFLEGGSHASGNDIDLGVNNRKGKRMRAEGGEALAIINKRRTRKYRKILPDVIDSFNKGTFEERYINAFDSADKLGSVINVNENIDLSGIESDLRTIRQQSERKVYMMPDGTIVMQDRNVKRIIRR